MAIFLEQWNSQVYMNHVLVKSLSAGMRGRGGIMAEYQPRVLLAGGACESDPGRSHDETFQIEPDAKNGIQVTKVVYGYRYFTVLRVGVRHLDDLPHVTLRVETHGNTLNHLHGFMGLIAARPDTITRDGPGGWYMVDILPLWPEGLYITPTTQLHIGANRRTDVRLCIAATHRVHQPETVKLVAVACHEHALLRSGDRMPLNFKWLVDHVVVYADDYSELDEIELSARDCQIARVRAAEFRADPFRYLPPSRRQVCASIAQVHELSKIMPCELASAVLPFVRPQRPDWVPNIYILPFSAGDWQWTLFPETGVDASRVPDIGVRVTFGGNGCKAVTAFTLARNTAAVSECHQSLRF